MLAEITPWSEVEVGDIVLVEGALAEVIAEVLSDVDTVRLFKLKFDQTEATTAVFKSWLTARLGNRD